MEYAIEIKNLSKVYKGGHKALDSIHLSIKTGEVFALLGPNGAGKTTLIDSVCGMVRITEGTVQVGGFDVVADYRKTRSLIGLVPQELHIDPFITVLAAVKIARGLYGKKHDANLIEKTLRMVSLWDKKDSTIYELSGGMKRRVLIARALMNEPAVLFLDEPTAGVDVELRRELWATVNELRATGTTIVLTTHYLEEAEQMADRIGVINGGKITLVEEKRDLMHRLGGKELILHLEKELHEVPDSLKQHNVTVDANTKTLTYTYKTSGSPGITALLNDVRQQGITFTDMETKEQTLEDIFVRLVHK